MLKRNLYKLESIGKVITYTPVIFILLLSSLILFASFIFIHSKEKREIQSLKEKAVLTYQFKEKEKLKEFIDDAKKDIGKDILSTKSNLSQTLFETTGYIKRLSQEGKDINYILSYLDKMEIAKKVTFALFDEHNLKVLKGEYLISYLGELVFGKGDKKIYDKLILKYIYSQGENNFQYWIDDIQKSIKVSFFNKVHILDKVYYIGVFSNISSLRDIAKEILIGKIDNKKDDYIWLYDIIKKEVYNFYKKKQFHKVDDILNETTKERKYSILQHYTFYEDKAYKESSYLMDKYKFLLVIEYNSEKAFKDKTEYMIKIKNYYNSLFEKVFIAVVLISLFLIIASLMFSKFVKTVFERYNRRFYLKNESLEHWKKRFELAIIASNDGLWDINLEKNYIYFSKKWLEISGYNRDEVKNFEDWFSLIHDDDKKKVRILFDEVMEGKREHIICEYRLKTKNRGYKWILARGKIFKNDKNEYKRMLMMSMDIDKSKRVSEELKSIKEDLKIRVQKEIEKNRQKDAFIIQQNKLASMGGMLGSIAHQWRQPLNNVGLILHFIKDNCAKAGFSKEMLQDYIQRARTQIEYMSETIDDFRNFYKPSKSKNLFNLEESIKSTLKIVKNQFEERDISITVFEKEKIVIYGYENELRQGVLNILNNAKDAIVSKREKEKFDAKIDIVIKRVKGCDIKNREESFESSKNFAIISIKNNGGNIKNDIIGRIFEPYFTTKFETQGTGIGLYMTKVIIEKNLNGKIDVKNIEDGVVFEIILPIEETIDEKD